MNNHAPRDYKCPICLAVKETENEYTLIKQSDIVYRDNAVTAFISSFAIGNNPGHVIIATNTHFENIYDIDEKQGHKVFDISKKISLAMKKVYKCEGITILQNNEPGANQHAYHYHVHVFPRYKSDELYQNMLDKRLSTKEDRATYAEKIKSALS